MKKPRPKYLPWKELSPEAQRRLDTEGHPSNRPTAADKSKPANTFAEDGSSWADAYLLADIFPMPK